MGWVFFLMSWSAYYLLHTLLASNTVKQWVKVNTPSMYRLYRIFYNLFFSIGLILLILWIILADKEFLFPQYLWAKLTGGVFLLCGSILLFLSLRNYDLKEFSGLSYLKKNPSEQPKAMLITSGLNKWVRHPLYLSLYILFTGIGLVYPTAYTWAAIGVSFIYIPLGIWSEEKKLIACFGEEYLRYRKTTPAVFPFLPW